MKKIAFMFGAGAEVDFELPSGCDLIRKSILLDDEIKSYITSKELGNVLANKFDGKYFNKKYKYQKYFLTSNDTVYSAMLSNVVYSMLQKDKTKFNKVKTSAISFLTEWQLKDLELTKAQSTTKEKKKEIINKLKMILKDKEFQYTYIKDEFLKIVFSKDKQGLAYIEGDVNLSGVLDNYFHTIINPSIFGKIKFTKIFNYYWANYLCIVYALIKFAVEHEKNKETLKKYFVDEKPSLEKILNNLSEFTKDLYNCKFSKEDSYYGCINKRLTENNELECSGIITTNYFNLAEQCIPCVRSEKFSYPNGKLCNFEYPEILEIHDFGKSKELGKKIFFPFIFGQSFVKPIVHDVQIKEYSKMAKILRDSGILVIIGYGINRDDNHVNSYLHEFMKDESKTLIKIEYEKNADKSNGDEIKEKKLKSVIESLCLQNFKNIINRIKIILTSGGDNSSVIDEVFKTVRDIKIS